MLAEAFKLLLYFVFLTTQFFFDIFTVTYYYDLIISEQQKMYHAVLPADSRMFKVDEKPTDAGIYDYIVVGAGSAGSVIASRLTENQNLSVLLIEAGGEESDFSDIPLMGIYLLRSRYNWNYNTTTQNTSCLGINNKQCPVPRGKGLGGTSIINALMHTRGNKKDYDDWKNQGNPGWGFDDLLPLFKRSENFKSVGDLDYRGRNGYLVVDNVKSTHIHSDAFIEANKELGRQEIDFNGKQQIGVGKSQMNIIKGRRQSVAKAFLGPAKNRTNLYIKNNSLVTKILISKSNKAYGVLFSSNGTSYKATCRKEIIVSAGTINSPQLLMLSGIGPKSHLEEMGIPVIQNLPVGRNLQDHAAYFNLRFETNHTESILDLTEHIRNYLNGFGRLTVGGNAHAIAFLQTNSSETSGQPDVELIILPSDNISPILQKARRSTNKKVKSDTSFTIILVLLHPESRGTVKLKSSSPYDFPSIDLNFLSDKEDIETMYKGVQLVLQLLETNAFKKLNASLVNNSLPTCKEHLYLSRSYWYCQLRQLTMSVFHPIGTCKMGPSTENGAVVTSKLQVHGVYNLRVADASVIPLCTSAHTNAPAIMIGEKLSQIIINDL